VAADTIYLVTIWIIPVIIAVTFHEAARGFVAHLLGDDTAWRLGRVSFNPFKHQPRFVILGGQASRTFSIQQSSNLILFRKLREPNWILSVPTQRQLWLVA